MKSLVAYLIAEDYWNTEVGTDDITEVVTDVQNLSHSCPSRVFPIIKLFGLISYTDWPENWYWIQGLSGYPSKFFNFDEYPDFWLYFSIIFLYRIFGNLPIIPINNFHLKNIPFIFLFKK